MLLGLMGLTACIGSKEPQDFVVIPAEVLYDQALIDLRQKDYKKAAETFSEVERQHPYHELAPQADILAAYAYFTDESYERALISLERFISLRPGHKLFPYAVYLKALCYYRSMSSVERDQELTKKAIETFSFLIQIAPNTDYAADSQLKLEQAQDHLAAAYMTRGRWLQRRSQYLAAKSRFSDVVDNFQKTSQIEEALYRLIEVHLALGLREEAEQYTKVLGHNYPNSVWYERGYKLLKGLAVNSTSLEG